MRVDYDGQIHEFPDDFTESEIRASLSQIQPTVSEEESARQFDTMTQAQGPDDQIQREANWRRLNAATQTAMDIPQSAAHSMRATPEFVGESVGNMRRALNEMQMNEQMTTFQEEYNPLEGEQQLFPGNSFNNPEIIARTKADLEKAKRFQQFAKGEAEVVRKEREERFGQVGQMAGGAVESGIKMLPGVAAAAVAGPGAGAVATGAVFGADSFSSSLNEAKDKGLSHQRAVQYATINGLAETIGNSMSALTFFKMGNGPMIKSILHAMGVEITTESATEVVNMVNEVMHKEIRDNKEFTWEEVAQRLQQVAGQSVLMTGAGKAAYEAPSRIKQHLAQKAQDKLETQSLDVIRQTVPGLETATNREVLEFLDQERQAKAKEVAAAKAQAESGLEPSGRPAGAQEALEPGPMGETGLRMESPDQELVRLGREASQKAPESPEGIPYERTPIPGTQAKDARSRTARELFLEGIEDARGTPLSTEEKAQLEKVFTRVRNVERQVAKSSRPRVRGKALQDIGRILGMDRAFTNAEKQRFDQQWDQAEGNIYSNDVPAMENRIWGKIAKSDGITSALTETLLSNAAQNMGAEPGTTVWLNPREVLGVLRDMAEDPNFKGDPAWKRVALLADLLDGLGDFMPPIAVRDYLSSATHGKSLTTQRNLSKTPFKGFSSMTAAVYDGISHEVILNPNAPSIDEHQLAATIFHELMHGMTSQALKWASKANWSSLKTPQEKQRYIAVANLNRLYKHAKEYATRNLKLDSYWNEEQKAYVGKQVYGFTNIAEFMSELYSNQQFQQVVDAILLPKTFQLLDNNLREVSAQTMAENRPVSIWKAVIKQIVAIVRSAWPADSRHRFQVNPTVLTEGLESLALLLQAGKGDKASRTAPEYETVQTAPILENKARTLQDQADDKKAFADFKASLPPAHRDLAERLWAKRKQNTTTQQAQAAASPAAPSNKNTPDAITNKFTPETKRWEQAKGVLLAVNDIPTHLLEKAGQLLSGGGKMYAHVKGNPLVRYGVDKINMMRRRIDGMKLQLLSSDGAVLDTWGRLSVDEQIQLKDIVFAPENYKKRWLTPQEMRDEYNMTPGQIVAYEAGRRAVEQVREYVNSRVAENEKIPERAGYWPARWSGAFYVEIYDNNGDMVRVEAADTKHQLKRLMDRFKREHPEFKVGKIKDIPRRGEVRARESAARDLFSVLKDTIGENNDLSAKLDEVFSFYYSARAERHRGTQHKKRSGGILGFRGQGYGRSDRQQTNDMMVGLEGYVADMIEYAEIKQNATDINRMLKDIEEADLPGIRSYLEDYWYNSNGFEGKFGSGFNQVIEAVFEGVGSIPGVRWAGVGPRTPHRMVSEMKHKALLLFLGFYRPIFLFTQVIQPAQFMMPKLIEMGLDISDSVKGVDMGVSMAVGYYDAMTWMFFNRQPTNDAARATLKYAKQMGLVDPHFFEELTSKGRKHRVSHWVTGQVAIQGSERMARTTALMQAAHYLEALGVPLGKIPEIAADAVDMAMTNYIKHERPMIYNKLGLVGDMMSPLTTFKHNFATQLYSYGKTALLEGVRDPRRAVPFATFIAIQMQLAGLMGLPGREDFDWLIKQMRNHIPGLGNLKTVTELMLELSSSLQGSGRDTVRYGVIAGATGFDVSPSFAAAQMLPVDGIKDIMAVPGKFWDIGSSAAKVVGEAAQGGDIHNAFMGFLKAVAPASLNPVVEALNQDKTGLIHNPQQKGAGTVRRPTPSQDPALWVGRTVGGPPTREADERNVVWATKGSEETRTMHAQSALNRAVETAMAGKMNNAAFMRYIELGGTVEGFKTALKSAWIASLQTSLQREQGLGRGDATARKIQKLQTMQRMQ